MTDIPCLLHEFSSLNIIQMSEDQTKLLCEQCLFDLEQSDGKITAQNCFAIKRLYQQPETILKGFDLPDELKNFFLEFQQWNQKKNENLITELENQIKNMQSYLSALLELFKQYNKETLNQRNMLKQQLKELLKFEEFQNIIDSLKSFDDSINPNQIISIEQKLQQYFKKTKKECQQYQFYHKFYEEIFNKNLNTNKIQKDIVSKTEQIESCLKKFNKDHEGFLEIIFPQIQLCKSDLLNFDFQQKLRYNLLKEKIKKMITTCPLIYKGTRDGLNGKSFWSKVNGKSNLLMIFKSQSNNVFGGYSPCCWSQNINSYVQDKTNSSFLFSQTHNEIYPIKDNNSNSIYCNSGYGPTFGDGHDIYIDFNNFQDGYSCLGYRYQWNEYPGQRSCYLFGSNKPNLIELEIFEINFLQ